MPALHIQSLSAHASNAAESLSGVTCDVADGQITALLGPPGAGKTLLLRVLAGLDLITSGDIVLDTASIIDTPPGRRNIALVAAEIPLFPRLTVRENIEYGLRAAGWSAEERRTRVAALLDALAVAGPAEVRADALDLEGARRTAIARAIAAHPPVLLLDDPLRGLPQTRARVLAEDLLALLRTERTTTLLATTEPAEALAIAERLVLLDHGAVIESGAADVLAARPGSAASAEVLGWVTVIDGARHDDRVTEPEVGSVTIESTLAPGTRATVMAHPGTLFAVPTGSGLGIGIHGTVVRTRPDGPQHLVTLALGSRRVDARWEWDLDPPPAGSAVELVARPGTLRCFDAALTPRAFAARTTDGAGHA